LITPEKSLRYVPNFRPAPLIIFAYFWTANSKNNRELTNRAVSYTIISSEFRCFIYIIWQSIDIRRDKPVLRGDVGETVVFKTSVKHFPDPSVNISSDMLPNTFLQISFNGRQYIIICKIRRLQYAPNEYLFQYFADNVLWIKSGIVAQIHNFA
jgi:hypothetical protein